MACEKTLRDDCRGPFRVYRLASLRRKDTSNNTERGVSYKFFRTVSSERKLL